MQQISKLLSCLARRNLKTEGLNLAKLLELELPAIFTNISCNFEILRKQNKDLAGRLHRYKIA